MERCLSSAPLLTSVTDQPLIQPSSHGDQPQRAPTWQPDVLLHSNHNHIRSPQGRTSPSFPQSCRNHTEGRQEQVLLLIWERRSEKSALAQKVSVSLAWILHHEGCSFKGKKSSIFSLNLHNNPKSFCKQDERQESHLLSKSIQPPSRQLQLLHSFHWSAQLYNVPKIRRGPNKNTCCWFCGFKAKRLRISPSRDAALLLQCR